MPEVNSSKSAPNRPSSTTILLRNWQYLVMVLLALAVAGMFLWNQHARTRLKNELSYKAERAAWQQNVSFLTSLSIPLGWAVRTEVIKGNYADVDEYFRNMIRQPNITALVLAKPDGVVLVATNKKLEGSRVADSFPKEVLDADQTTVSSFQKGLLSVTPITNLNRKIGILLIAYAPPPLLLK